MVIFQIVTWAFAAGSLADGVIQQQGETEDFLLDGKLYVGPGGYGYDPGRISWPKNKPWSKVNIKEDGADFIHFAFLTDSKVPPTYLDFRNHLGKSNFQKKVLSEGLIEVNVDYPVIKGRALVDLENKDIQGNPIGVYCGLGECSSYIPWRYSGVIHIRYNDKYMLDAVRIDKQVVQITSEIRIKK